jgi:preprotein translocase subunit SecA
VISSGSSDGAGARRTDWRRWIDRLRGSPVRHDIERYAPALADISAREPILGDRSDGAIAEEAARIRDAVRAGETLDDWRSHWYALARDMARRTLGQRPFDTQVVAALALDEGHVVEMQTGEGKTLAAVMPASLNALTGRGVHVLTFNDYLARRDAEWMGPVYRALGLSVAFVQQGMSARARREAYAADVTYVTAREAGFDHLRDLVAARLADVVHRPAFHFAIVDEADSLLIDEAGVPLVLATGAEPYEPYAPRLAEAAAALSPGEHFDTDEYGRSVGLTDAGVDRVERLLGCGVLHDAHDARLLSAVHCALHARVLLRRDVDYIVRSGRIEMVDEHTGRTVADRCWPDGLQAALEAKEGLARRADGRILASQTLQGFLRRYARLSGMTGTAVTAAEELHHTYGLDVIVVPPHRPVLRIDREDLVFTHREAKQRAVIEDVRHAHALGRPVLVGTASVIESDRLAAQLARAGLACQVLNARNDAEEAAIVARAGGLGAITISTNMAGRGTDIRLGGEDEADRDRVAALGGLYVIGTNRHESRRVDLQLRGRAGRQGDPGESRFLVSLDDDLLVRYGFARLVPRHLVPARSDGPIESAVIRREVARTQRIVEGQQFELRRTLARYARVVEQQHEALVKHRQALLAGDDVPHVWARAARRRAALVAAAGEAVVLEAEREVVLACIDHAWSEHLAICADLREGIHLARLAGEDPLTRFTKEAIAGFSRLDDGIDDAALDALDRLRVVDGRIDLTAAGLLRPSSTWTYLVNDDPFRTRIGTLLTGPGGATVAIYAAAVLAPLLILWGVVDRWFGRSQRARGSSME